jgi:hypothetical protein
MKKLRLSSKQKRKLRISLNVNVLKDRITILKRVAQMDNVAMIVIMSLPLKKLKLKPVSSLAAELAQ